MSRLMRKAAPWRDLEIRRETSRPGRLKGCSVQFPEPEPAGIAGYSGHSGWRYSRTDEDDASKAQFVKQLWARLGH